MSCGVASNELIFLCWLSAAVEGQNRSVNWFGGISEEGRLKAAALVRLFVLKDEGNEFVVDEEL